MNREDITLKSVEEAQKGEFGLTAVKVEMEAGLGRRGLDRVERNRNGNCIHCTRGSIACACCEDENRPGYHQDEDGGEYDCDDCETTGRLACGRCMGNYHADTPQRNWQDDTVCLDFLLEYLAQFGLARRRRRGEIVEMPNEHDHYGKWVPKKPLVFSYLYSDGGDTEWTFTLLVTDKLKALLLRDCVDAFNALAAAIRADGGYPQINIESAGMHMSLLNDPNGMYEAEPRPGDMRRFENFRKSMILLLPAIYFLGASNDTTRHMNPRTPNISNRDKYSAVYYQGGALEFRVFDTCYDNREQILDNLIVMCKSLRYWSSTYKRNYLDKVTSSVSFGNNNNNKLERLYNTIEHVELLNRGLRLLKPDHLSITDLKKQRKFKVSKRALNSKLKQVIAQAELDYKEYERRFGWEIVMHEQNYINRELDNMRAMSGQECTPAAMRKIRQKAKKLAKQNISSKQTCELFTKAKVDNHNKSGGRWTLSLETA